MPNHYYRSYYQPPQKRKSSKPTAYFAILIILVAIGYFIFQKPADHIQPKPSPAIPQPSTINVSIDSNFKHEFRKLIAKYQISNPKTTINFTDIKPDLKITSKPIPKTTQVVKTIHAREFSLTPSKLSNLIPEKPYAITAVYTSNHTTAQDLANFLSNQFEDSASTKTTTLLAVGDMMLSRHVGTVSREAKDTSYPFRATYQTLSKPDITYGNLENPFYDQGPPITEGMSFKAEPNMISGLKLSGFDIVDLANNHFGNQGQAGIKYSLKYLKKNNIKYTGAGNNFDEAHTATIIEKNGVKFGFLSYVAANIYPTRATATEAGDSILEIPQMKKDVAAAHKIADVVIVCMHAGVEYTPNPSLEQKRFARSAINTGADLVIGHHPHVVEAVEIYQGKPILYSLGNFVFDQMWSTETTQGIAANITFTGKKVSSIDLKPLQIRNYAQPYFLTPGQSYNQIINRILQASQKLKES